MFKIHEDRESDKTVAQQEENKKYCCQIDGNEPKTKEKEGIMDNRFPEKEEIIIQTRKKDIK